MSSKTAKKNPQTTAAATTAASGPQWWWFAIGLVVAFFTAFEIYGPTLRAPFVFDDRYLPFLNPAWSAAPLANWLNGVRPLLMFGYWINYQSVQTEPYQYHVVNVLFHFANGVLAWLAVRRILEWADVATATRETLAIFSGFLFLVHPIQTESVAYIASRSESQSLFFFLGAFVVFLYRRQQAASVLTTISVLLLFALAALTKEHTAVLPGLLLLTDYYWNPGFTFEGIKRNWKLYAPIVIGGVVAVAGVARLLASAPTAGFGMKDLPWYQYFFTQCRALWVYLRMFVLPYGQNIDHEFAISRSIVDGGAIIGLLALIGVAVAAWIWRREYKLASYGYFAFLLLMAPTSSVVPIRDVLVERRVYLAFVPLLLIACEGLRRLKVNTAALVAGLGALVFVYGFFGYQRAEVWSDPTALWKDTAQKAPNKSRPHFQLAYAYFTEGKCAEAAQEYATTEKLDKPDYSLYIDWGLALDCANQPEQALQRFEIARGMERTAHVYSLIGMVHAKRNEREAAMTALDEAQKLDPRFEIVYVYKGNLFLLGQDFTAAEQAFKTALQLNPADQAARAGLDFAQRRVVPTVR